MIQLTSGQNPRYKQALKLRTRRGRVQQDRFLVDGLRETERFLRSDFALSEFFCCPEWLSASTLQRLDETARSRQATCFAVASEMFAKLAYGDRGDGVIAAGRIHRRTLESLPVSTNPLVCVVESLEKPGNVGAILRSADGAGVDAVVHANAATDWFHPNAIRASTGAVFALPVVEASSAETLAWLQQQGLQILVAVPEANLDYYHVDYTRPSALVLGNEAQGLSDVWRSDATTPIRIPMHGIADSLNVSVTAAVLLFEAMRQRAQATGG